MTNNAFSGTLNPAQSIKPRAVMLWTLEGTHRPGGK